MLFSEIVDEFYEPKEYPALALLLNEWERTKPFDGLRVLAATPIFRNTMVQYMALLAGGAILSVGRSLGKGSAAMPFDSEVVEYVRDCGVPVVTDEDLKKYIISQLRQPKVAVNDFRYDNIVCVKASGVTYNVSL